MKRGIITLLMALLCLGTACAANRALLVGIGRYDTRKTGWGRIHGDEDVDMLVPALLKQGFPQSHIHTLKDSEATKGNIVDALKRLAKECRPGDRVLFLFSGHGQLVSNLNGDKEESGFDEAIVPFDAYRTGRYAVNGKKYDGENHLIDDELSPLLDAIKVKIGKKGVFFVAFDACHSQGMEQTEGEYFSTVDLEIMGPVRGTADVFKPANTSHLRKLPRPSAFSPGGRMIVVAACGAEERNHEYKIPGTTKVVGSLSNCIRHLLKKDSDFIKWEKYFRDGEYKGRRLFVSTQHPSVTVY